MRLCQNPWERSLFITVIQEDLLMTVVVTKRMNRLGRAYVFQLRKLSKNIILIRKLVVLFVVREQIDDTQQLFQYAQSHYMILS